MTHNNAFTYKILVVCQNYINPVAKRLAVRQRVKCFSSHNNRFVNGLALKELLVLLNIKKLAAV